MAKLRRFLVFVALAFSFGGFTFYAGVVVPIGGEVLGAATQGFVTRQVTQVINGVTLATVVVLIWEAIAGRRTRCRRATRSLIAFSAAVAICTLVLVAWHARMDALLDAEHQSVLDEPVFYGRHRVYLWVSSLQWLLMWPIVWIVATSEPVSTLPTKPAS